MMVSGAAAVLASCGVRQTANAEKVTDQASDLAALPPGLAFWWAAHDLPKQGLRDGQAVATWPDSQAGATARQNVAEHRPIFKTGVLNGLAAVCFRASSKQVLRLPHASDGTPLARLIDSADYSVMIGVRPIATTGLGMPFGAYKGGVNDGAAFGYIVNGEAATRSDGGLYQRGIKYRADDAPLLRFGSTMATGDHGGVAKNGLERIFANGSCIGGLPRSGGLTFGNDFGIGSGPADPLAFDGFVFDILVFDRALSVNEMVQVDNWFCDRYAVDRPARGTQKVAVFSGSSLVSMGTQGDNRFGGVQACVSALGLKLGQWHNLAIGGSSLQAIARRVPLDLAPLARHVGPAKVVWANMEGFNTLLGSSGNQAAHAMADLLSSVSDAGIVRTTFGTITDAKLLNREHKHDYVSAHGGVHDPHVISPRLYRSIIDVHLDPRIGVDGACPLVAPGVPYFTNDLLHLSNRPGFPDTPSGQGVLGALFSAAMLKL